MLRSAGDCFRLLRVFPPGEGVGGIVLEEPFRQEELNGVLQKTLASERELASLREKSLAYGKSKALAFHDRAQRAVEIMERLVKYV